MKYVYAPLTKQQFPKTKDVVTAIALADLQDDVKRDTRPLHAVLERISEASSRVAGHLSVRRTAVSAMNYTVKSTTGNPEEAAAAKNRVKNVIDAIMKFHTDTVSIGAMLLELSWSDKIIGQDSIPTLKKHYTFTEIEKTDDNKVSIYQTANSAAKKLVERLTDKTFIVDTDDRSSRGGVLRSVMFNEIIISETLQEFFNTNSLLKGVVTGEINLQEILNSGVDVNKELAEINKSLDDTLENLGDKNYLKSPTGVKLAWNKIVDGTAGKSFIDLIDKLNTDTAIALLGQSGTSEIGSNGSRAALQVLNMIRADISFQDMKRVEAIINDLLLFDYQMNLNEIGTAQDIPYTFEFIIDENADIIAASQMFATLATINVKVNTNEFYAKLGLTVPASVVEPEITLSAAAQNNL
jgi:phage gp29-like protein